VATAPALAVAPGANGKLLYTLQTMGNFDIWTIESDGSGNTPLVVARRHEDRLPQRPHRRR